MNERLSDFDFDSDSDSDSDSVLVSDSDSVLDSVARSQGSPSQVSVFGSLMWIVLAVAPWLLPGCADDQDVTVPVEIKVERHVETRSFRVTWFLDHEASGLVFTRGLTAFRSVHWIPQGAGQVIERRVGRDVLLAPTPARQFVVRIAENFFDGAGDHPLMSQFTDGAILFYTGHLDAAPIVCQGPCSDPVISSSPRVAIPTRVILVPAADEHVLVNGPAVDSEMSISPGMQGALAYFGTQVPVPGLGYSVLADPGMPQWLLLEMDRYFPRILDLQGRRLNFPSTGQPIVFLPYRDGEEISSFTHSGGVVGEQMFLALFGPEWIRRGDEVRRGFLELLAHESFHFWNASRFNSVDVRGGRWLHEGGAEAIASISLLELGVISQSRFEERQEESLNRCMGGLIRTTLPDSNSTLTSRNHYECGAVLQYVAERELRNRGLDLWALWRRVFEKADGADGFYKHETFLELLATLLPDASVTDRLKMLVSGSVSGANGQYANALETYFSQLYGSVGMKLESADSQWPGWYHRLLAGQALSAIMLEECGGEGYYVPTGTVARLVGGPRCRSIRSDFELSRVGRHPVWKEGVQVYDFVHQECRFHTHVPLSTPRGSMLAVPCPRLPIRPKYLRLARD